MKRIVMLMIMLGLLFAAARNEAAFIAPWVGTTHLGLTQVNQDLEMRTGNASANEFTKINDALMLGVDSGIFRLGYIPPVSGKISWTGSLGESNSVEIKPSLIMGMLGFQFYSIPDFITMGIYGGGVVSMYEEKRKTQLGGAVSSADITATGFAPAGELSAGIRVFRTLQLEIGYRYCIVSSIKATVDAADLVTATLIRSGDVIKDRNGNDMQLDYSGLLARLSFTFGGTASNAPSEKVKNEEPAAPQDTKQPISIQNTQSMQTGNNRGNYTNVNSTTTYEMNPDTTTVVPK